MLLVKKESYMRNRLQVSYKKLLYVFLVFITILLGVESNHIQLTVLNGELPEPFPKKEPSEEEQLVFILRHRIIIEMRIKTCRHFGNLYRNN